MAASHVDSEIGEYQATFATAAVSGKVVKSWSDHNHRVEKSLGRPKIRDRKYSSRYDKSDNDDNITENYCTKNDADWSKQKKSLFKKENNIVVRSNINKNTKFDKCNIFKSINDHKTIVHKEDNEDIRDSKDKFEGMYTIQSNNKIKERTQKVFNEHNYTNKTVLDNEYDERETHVVREIKIASASTNNCISNPSKSAYLFHDADKTISSGKRAGNSDSRKDEYDEDAAEPMEISSPQSCAYSHEDDVVASVAVAPSAHCKTFRDKAKRKVVHTFTEDSHMRSLEKTRQSARNENRQEDSRNQETDIIVANENEHGVARKCEDCGEPHFSYGRYSPLWKYSRYLNRDTIVYRETTNQDAVEIVANRETNSVRHATPIAAAVLYRSRSPRLSVHDSGVACSDHVAPEQTHAAVTASRQLVADLRQLLTLKQHYYPEGGWGWIVLLAGLLVQILSHGTHGAVSVFLQQIAVKFGPHVRMQAGW